ncbi:hypothetical protein Tco_0969456 [Tanacetum coccineum]
MLAAVEWRVMEAMHGWMQLQLHAADAAYVETVMAYGGGDSRLGWVGYSCKQPVGRKKHYGASGGRCRVSTGGRARII